MNELRKFRISTIGSFLLVAGMFTATRVVAADDQAITNGPPTRRLWTFTASMQQLKLHGDRGNDVTGRSGQVGFGLGGFVSDRFLVQGLVSLHAGPWDRVRDSSFNADFSGTGVTIESIYALTGSTLRSGGSVWSGVLSLGYVDLVGKSIGPNRKEPTDPNSREGLFQEQNYQINMTAIFINPGIEWTHMQSPRPTGNTTELLATRVEGVSLRIEAGIPVFATFRTRSTGRDDTPNASQDIKERVDKGRLRGYSVITSVHTWLGT